MHPNDQLVIERATLDDVETIADRWVSLAREQRSHGSHVLAEPNRGTIVDVLGAHRVADGLLVGRLDDEIVGFATFTVEHGSFDLDVTRGVLTNLYVAPDRRNRGIGSTLLTAVESELASRNVAVLSLEVLADNEAARRFYQRNGYHDHRVTLERPIERTGENDTHSKQQR